MAFMIMCSCINRVRLALQPVSTSLDYPILRIVYACGHYTCQFNLSNRIEVELRYNGVRAGLEDKLHSADSLRS
jgi:hypothetical protein